MRQTRTYYAKKNIMLGYLNKIMAIILEFILRAVFIRFLGEELLGVNGVFVNVIQVLSLAELGLNNVVAYSFYKPLAQNDTERLNSLVHFYKKVYNYIATTVLGIGLALIPFLNKIINTELPINDLYGVYLIFLADTVFSYFFVYKTMLLHADQKGYIATKYTIFSELIITILQIIVIVLFHKIILYLLVKVLINLLKNYLLSKKAEHDYDFLKSDYKKLDKEETIELANTIKSGFIYKLSSVLLNSTDNIIISTFIGTVWVGYLANYNTISLGLSSFYTIIFSSLTAGVGNLVETESVDKKEEFFHVMLLAASWIAIVFSVCFYALADDFVKIWLGEKFVMNDLVVISKAIIIYLNCSLQPVFSYREVLGLYRKTKYIMLTAAVLNIGLSIVLGIWFSVGGVLLATIISMLMTYYWYEPIILYKECFQKKSGKYFRKRIIDWSGLAVLFVLLYLLKGKIVADGWIMWILKAFIVFAWTNLFCLLLYGKTNEFSLLRQRIIKIFRKD